MHNCPNCGNSFTPGDEICQYCGFVFPFSTDIMNAGTILQERYKIEELTHSGGMGYVYPARDTKLHDRLCIVKQVKEPVKSDDDLRKLEEEAIEMAKLNHPNVAMIFDHFVEGQFYFLVVEHISGKTLSEIFEERNWQLNEGEVINWAISMCDVVGYLHREGIVHRDISPQNIMLTDDGIIKFIDFGTLRELRHITTGGTAGMGKYGYTPPEQWLGKPEARSDIFALGATIYYLLTGFLPLSAEFLTSNEPQKSEFNPAFPPIREKNSRISPELESVLQKTLQLDIDLRYSSVIELGQALRNLIEVKAPVLSVDCERFDFNDIVAGRQSAKKFTIMNVGTGRLTGKLIATKPWLTLSPSTLNMEAGEQEISLTVDTAGTTPSFSDTGSINIITNGGEASIDISLSTTSFAKRAFSVGMNWTWRMKWIILLLIAAATAVIIVPNTILETPSVNIDVRQIDFDNVRIGDMSNSRTITITNTGGSILSGTVKSTKDWLTVTPTELKLPYGEGIITAHLDTKKMPYPFEDTGFINVETNGGNLQIIVNVTTTNVIYEDDFSNSSSGWTTSSSNAGEAKYENVSYNLAVKSAGHIIAGTNLSIGQLGDFILEVDAALLLSTEDCGYGVIFRQEDVNRFDNFYYFQISNSNRQYKVEKQSGGKISVLKEWTSSNYINSAPSNNRLKVACKGAQLEIYANGNKLDTIIDNSFQKGFIGLVAESGMDAQSKTKVSFDNLAIYFPD